MSEQYPGGFVTKSPPTPAGPYENSSAYGIWTVSQAAAYQKQGLWPIPGNLAPGQQAYTSDGTYSWIAPAGVTSVSVVCVGAGASNSSGGGYAYGGGGALAYKNNISVTPGSSYTVVVGAGGPRTSPGTVGGDSYFISTGTVWAQGGRTSGSASYTGDGGGNGGAAGQGGSGAGGYSGSGGQGGVLNDDVGASGSGGGGGGAGGRKSTSNYEAGGGGGVGILGAGSSGSGTAPGVGGGGGSGGSAGQDGYIQNGTGYGGNGGNYGGGGGAGRNSSYADQGGGGAVGAVRIIWPGTTRSFPSTNTGNL